MKKSRFIELSDLFEVIKLQRSRTRLQTSQKVPKTKALSTLPHCLLGQCSTLLVSFSVAFIYFGFGSDQ